MENKVCLNYLVFTISFLFLLPFIGNTQTKLKPIEKDGKWGYADYSNNIVMDYQFEKAKYFSNGIGAVKKDGKWGYINQFGEYSIPSKYEEAGTFHCSTTFAKLDGKYGLINQKDSLITPMQYDTVFGYKFFVNSKDGVFGVIDSLGQEVVPNIYEEINSYSPAYACVKKDGKWGSIVEGVEDFENEAIFRVPHEMPKFPGCKNKGDEKEWKSCADRKLLQFIYSKIRYPKEARKTGIEGTVVISFVVDKKGKIQNIELVREIGGGCGAECLRVLDKMPTWIAGRHEGNAVSTKFNLPVKFRLE